MNFETILKRMLDSISNDLDKREGSIIYNALAPAAAELAQMYIELYDVMDRTFADTAVGEDLARRTAERGIIRHVATKAKRKGEFNIDVSVGSRFGIEDTTFIVVENLDNFESVLECEDAGIIGNSYTGTLQPITNITGLTTAELTDILIPGDEEETDEELRIRYFDNLSSQAYGGNIADYKEKTKGLAGVGGVKVYPVWDGGGTVKLVIIDSTFNKPSPELVDVVQTEIDPVTNSGEGLGIAPIGHVVTVEGVTELTVDVSFTLTYVEGYVWDDVEVYIQETIDNYLLDLKRTWDSEDNLVVRIAQIESAILQVTGVLDITGTKLNDGVTNLILTDVEIPVLGTVTDV